jgi:hypothetical protein
MANIASFLTNNWVGLLQLAVLYLAYRQLKLTSKEVSQPEWEIVEVKPHGRDEDNKHVNIWVMNTGKGRAREVEFYQFDVDFDLDSVPEDLDPLRKEDVLDVHRDFDRKIMEPGEKTRLGLRVEHLKYIDCIRVRVKSQDARFRILELKKEWMEDGYKNKLKVLRSELSFRYIWRRITPDPEPEVM